MPKLKYLLTMLLATFVALSISLPNNARADQLSSDNSKIKGGWTFDPDQCSPLTEHEILQKMPPAVMIMVDRSGSMTSRADSSSSASRWVVAKSAVDKITTDMTTKTPNQLEFGLGMYQGTSSAIIYHQAMPNANPAIMATMNRLNPTGGTPTAQAITAMYKSATVRGTVDTGPFYRNLGRYINPEQNPIQIPDSYGVGETSRSCGFLWLSTCYSYSKIKSGAWVSSTINVVKSQRFDRLRFDVEVNHSRGLNEYDIELLHGGKRVDIINYGQLPESQKSIIRMEILGFNGHNMNGAWELRIRDRYVSLDNQGRITPSAGSLVSWGLYFDEKITVDTTNRATAGILITDGYPNNATTAIAEACKHRDVAPLYMIGLGSSTDTAYNNIMAAAGGTGSCTGGDVCDNPSRYNNFRGKCTGSYQANNATALGVALSQISSAISCTYPLSVLGGGTVPPSNQGCEGYDCVYVSLDGGFGRIYHEESTQSPKGWSWASATERKLVKLNEHYCGKVQTGQTRIVETQVACLCTEKFDDECHVFDPDTCECPTGRWTCNKGTDTCDPSASCNGPRVDEGEPCSNGKLGICEEFGQTVCSGNKGYLTCNAGPGPPPRTEVCNGLDDNCDGIVDNVDWQGIATCHVDSGRHKAAIIKERTRCNIGHAYCIDGQEICEPLLPMPEMCNGLDDDCDDLIDNLAGSHERYNFEQRFSAVVEGDAPAPARPELSGDYETAACFERDICNCPDGYTDITSPEYMSDSYEDFLETYWKTDGSGKPTCICRSGLTH